MLRLDLGTSGLEIASTMNLESGPRFAKVCMTRSDTQPLRVLVGPEPLGFDFYLTYADFYSVICASFYSVTYALRFPKNKKPRND